MKAGPIFSTDTLDFFTELEKNNRKPWMDENRDRYKSSVVVPFRELLDRLSPIALKLNPRFHISGRTGENFSRINRDIRFAADKSPYRTQMYLFFSEGGGERGQLYVGLSPEALTAGFRIYSDGKDSPLLQFGRGRGAENPAWLGQQKKRLGRKCESYWYSTEKGGWTKHSGWPLKAEDWKKLQGWVVRKKLKASLATKPGLEREIEKIFGEVYPLLPFAGQPNWKP
ncbi:MAG TPA: DUF2461 family protein [Candidatus Acidoferrum sp.]|nr:DUF2461 family protein [Candidatus Acidoferrum sp.]